MSAQGPAEITTPWPPIRVVHLSELHFAERSATEAPGAAQVLRGGSWVCGSGQVRSSARGSGPPSLGRDLNDIGFLLVLPTPAQVG